MNMETLSRYYARSRELIHNHCCGLGREATAELCGLIDVLESEAIKTYEFLEEAEHDIRRHAAEITRHVEAKFDLQEDLDRITDERDRLIDENRDLRKVKRKVETVKRAHMLRIDKVERTEAQKSISEIQREVHALAREKGWWDGVGNEFNVGDTLARISLVHAELSEAVEAVRDGSLLTWRYDAGKPEGLAIELADAVIRIMDLCGGIGIDLETAIEKKHEYNKTRPFRHGGKLA